MRLYKLGYHTTHFTTRRSAFESLQSMHCKQKTFQSLYRPKQYEGIRVLLYTSELRLSDVSFVLFTFIEQNVTDQYRSDKLKNTPSFSSCWCFRNNPLWMTTRTVQINGKTSWGARQRALRLKVGLLEFWCTSHFAGVRWVENTDPRKLCCCN
jgi:hypothetical protein